MRLQLACSLFLGFGLSLSAYAGAMASSFKPERRRGTNFWNANSSIDGDNATAWMVAGESENKGEWIMLDIPKSSVVQLGMMPGFAESDETFQDYARIKEVQIQVFQYDDMQELQPIPGTVSATFEDAMEFQIIDIDDLVVESEGGGRIKITVTDFYPGRDFPNFGVSEVLVYLNEFEVATTITDVSNEAAGHTRAEMVDDNARTHWVGTAEGASVTFEASGYTLAQVGVQAGPATYARPKKVQIVANGRTHVQELENSGDLQWIQIPAISGYTGSAWGDIEMQILEVWPGSAHEEVAISELDLHATAYEGF